MSDSAAAVPTGSPETGADTGSGGDDSYIDNIIAAGTETSLEGSSDRTEAGGKTASPGVPAQAEPPASAEPTESIDQQLASLAADTGLNPADPRDREVLTRFAAKLSASQTKPDGGEEELTEFEKSLLQPPPVEERPQPPLEQPKRDAGPVLPAVDANWRDPIDAYKDLMNAYGRTDDPNEDKEPDLKKVAAIENAMWARRFQAQGLPAVQDMVMATLHDVLGDILPTLRAREEANKDVENYDYAMAELKKTKSFNDVDDLYKHLDDTKIKFRGREWPNTPINQVYSRYPHLLDIKVDNPNKDVAARLTYVKRLKAVKSHWNEMKSAATQTIPVQQAATLVNAGQQIAQRQAAERTRQTLNGGRSASGAGTTSKDPDRDWFDRVAKPKGRITAADL